MKRVARFFFLLTILLPLFPAVAFSEDEQDPRPGYFKPGPPGLPIGYFEVFNNQNGLPTDNICSVLMIEKQVLVGTQDSGLLILRDQMEETQIQTLAGVAPITRRVKKWLAFTPDTIPAFPSMTVQALARGYEPGSAYAGTPAGIVKISNLDGVEPVFDLVRFPSIPSRNILSLKIEDGLFFAGTDNSAGGVSSSTFTPFTVADDRFPQGFGCIEKMGDRVWFGTSAGLFEAKGNSLVRFEIPDFDFGWVYSLESLDSDLLVGCSRGLFLLENASWTQFIADTWVKKLIIPEKAERTIANLHFRYPPIQAEVQESYPVKLEAMRRRAWELYKFRQDSQRNPALLPTFRKMQAAFQADSKRFNERFFLLKGLWAGTEDRGAWFFPDDAIMRNFTAENSKLPSNRISALDESEDGETWIGTPDAGLLHYTRYTFPPMGPPELVCECEATALKVVGDLLYIGTNDGLQVVDYKNLGQPTLINNRIPDMEFFHKSVTGIAADQTGNVWVAGDRGVWRLGVSDRQHFEAKDHIPDDCIENIDIDESGRVFISGGPNSVLMNQIAVFNGTSFSPYSMGNLRKIAEESPASAAAILQALGMLGAFQKSVDPNDLKTALAVYGASQPDGDVSTILGHPKFLLVGTYQGYLYIFDGEGFKRLARQGSGFMGSRILRTRKNWSEAITIMTKDEIHTFNGKDWNAVVLPDDPEIARLTDLAIDDRNCELIWASFEGVATHGIGLYQNMGWQISPASSPVELLEVGDPYLLFATKEGVFRVVK